MAIKNKKAILFTLISVLIAVLFIFLFTPGRPPVDEDKQIAISTRIQSTGSHVELLEDYITTTLELSGKQAFIALADYVRSEGYFEDHEEMECVYTDLLMKGETTTYTPDAGTVYGNNRLAIKFGDAVVTGLGDIDDQFFYWEHTFGYTNTQEITMPYDVDVSSMSFYLANNIRHHPGQIDASIEIYKIDPDCDTPTLLIARQDGVGWDGYQNPDGPIQERTINFNKPFTLHEGETYHIFLTLDDNNFGQLIYVIPAAPEANSYMDRLLWERLDVEYTTNIMKSLGGTDDFTFQSAITEIVTLSEQDLHLVSGVTVESVQLHQLSPWEINLSVNVSYFVNDSYSEWTVNNKQLDVILPVQGMVDPRYVSEMDVQLLDAYSALDETKYNLVEMKKNDSLLGPWSLEADTDTEKLEKLNALITEGYYVESSRAPSFLARFNETMFINGEGVERFMDDDLVAANGNYEDQTSYVDYLIWEEETFDCEDMVEASLAISNPFRLDFGSAIYFNLSNTTGFELATCTDHCTDGVQNGDELAVDCGGSCGPCNCADIGGSLCGATDQCCGASYSMDTVEPNCCPNPGVCRSQYTTCNIASTT